MDSFLRVNLVRITMVILTVCNNAIGDVFVLQGEKGEKGSPGEKGPPGEQGEKGETGEGLICDSTTCTLSNEQHIWVNGSIEADIGIFDSLTVKKESRCPIGYTVDTSVTDYILCKRAVAEDRFDEMVKVKTFWIDKYEMSVWENEDCTGAQYGSVENNWRVPGNGSAFLVDDVYGCSIKDSIPSRITTWFNASQSCLASQKQLCRNAEWQMAALGTPDSFTEIPISVSPSCNIWNGLLPQNGTWGVNETITTTGSAIECVSNVGANDMVGNLAEWIEDWGIGGIDWMKDDINGAHSWPSLEYNNDSTWGIDGSAFNGVEYVEGLPVAVVRGGAWEDGSAAGVYAISYKNAPSTTEWRYGARCCKYK